MWGYELSPDLQSLFFCGGPIWVSGCKNHGTISELTAGLIGRIQDIGITLGITTHTHRASDLWTGVLHLLQARVVYCCYVVESRLYLMVQLGPGGL